ncbi:MAG: NADH-quinone oxidoreductase subunit J [Anaerolineae bacterium]
MELTIELLVFFVFAAITVLGGAGVVLARNLFRAALLLLLSLFGVAGLFVLLSAPFLAAVQVLIYMGGIAILIIFAVMLTRGMVRVRNVYTQQWDLAAVVALAFLALMIVVIVQLQQGDSAMMALAESPGAPLENSTSVLGAALVDPAQFMLPFEVASVLLAGALIGAIYIARDDESE